MPRVGFHPNGTLAVSSPTGDPHLVLNAEAENFLRTYRASSKTAPQFIAEVASPAPKDSVVVSWPGWGKTLAVSEKAGPTVRFYKGFDPARPAASALTTAQASNKPIRHVEGITAANLDGQQVDSIVAAVPFDARVVAFDPSGTDAVEGQDLWQFERHTFVHVILPVDFDGDGDDDLFVLGEQMPVATLLVNAGGRQFTRQDFPLEGRGAQSGVATLEADGSLLLWVGGEEVLLVLRWDAARSAEPQRWVLPRPARDWLRFGAGDLNADGHQDLVMGASARSISPIVVYGPLTPRVDEIGRWIASQGRSRDTASKSSTSLP
jgi:hypothetical protein